MAFTHPALETIFLASVAVLWAMIFYQLLFAFLGFAYRQRALREQAELDALGDVELPGVSILVPAHNEELVIEQTVRALLALNYPEDLCEIIVVNDGSTDSTAEIVTRLNRENPRVRLFNVPKEEAAQGKSHALNLGLADAKHDLVAIYDADNTPEPDALRYLVLNMVRQPKLAACFGKFRTRNRKQNLLTRFINLETLSFQFMLQAGRYLLFNIAILPGTNFVMRKGLVLKHGAWDEDALTEDSELSIRLYSLGYEIKFVPYSVTWEEEPEEWGTWIRQRTRWVRGNFYVLRKFLVPSFRFGKLSLTFEILHLFLLYYLFLGAILISHLIFILSAFGFIAVMAPGPYMAVWACAYLLFIAEIAMCASYEDEASPTNIAVIALMYFTYCQAWIILVFRAVYQEYIQGGKVKWEKTQRFASTPGKPKGGRS
jgi:cellulose synthase/poly-beta-1,6-N-acetylglucosamine synthase-like glycosyltransferase